MAFTIALAGKGGTGKTTIAALAVRALKELFEKARLNRLTRHQHVLFRLGELAMQAETAANLSKAAAGTGRGPRPSPEVHRAMARLYARESAANVAHEGLKWLRGCDLKEEVSSLERALLAREIHEAQAGLMADLDLVGKALCGAEAGDQAQRLAG